MKQEKQFIKVVGTVVTGNVGEKLETKIGRGIVQLKRGTQLIDYAKDFLAERGVIHCTLNQRGENTWSTVPIMFVVNNPMLVITYVFTQFPLSEIGYYGKDLTKVEMVRDFKFLKNVVK